MERNQYRQLQTITTTTINININININNNNNYSFNSFMRRKSTKIASTRRSKAPKKSAQNTTATTSMLKSRTVTF